MGLGGAATAGGAEASALRSRGAVTSLITGKEMEWRLCSPDRTCRWQLQNVRAEHCKGHFMEEEGPQASHEGLEDSGRCGERGL